MKTTTITTPISLHSHSVSEIFRAIRVRNYRLFFYGQLTSMVGTWMQSMVQSWLVYRLTGSALWLGVITFVMQGTAFFTSPVAGYIVDRTDRRKLLIWIEVGSMIQAFLLAALVFTGTIRIWQLAVLSALLGVANSFESTTRHSFAFDLVGRADLSSAIGLNSVTINLSRVIGPSIAGALIALLGTGGEGWCFVINGASFLAVIFCLALMREEELHTHRGPKTTEAPSGFVHQLTLGLRYVQENTQIRDLLLFTTFMSFVGFPYAVIMPFIATQTLHGGANTLGWLTGTLGVGALFGGLSASRPRKGTQAIWRKILSDLFFLGFSLVILGLSRSMTLSMCAATALGFFLMGSFPLVNSTIQTLVDDSVRGRVVSLYTMSFLGAGPLGSLVMGSLTDGIGVQKATIGCGVFCVLSALAAFYGRRSEQAKPI
ncbi:MAG: MFS transporter [Oligoflexia bacterium]|nr:MFS transporter [Oligoflexia bacterium]